jgi:hypothetical protein
MEEAGNSGTELADAEAGAARKNESVSVSRIQLILAARRERRLPSCVRGSVS